MKKVVNNRTIVFLIVTIAGLLAIYSCSKDDWTRPVTDRQITTKIDDPPAANYYTSAPYSYICVTPTTATLYADETTNVGTVSVTNTDDSIFVTYSTSGNWTMNMLILYVGDISMVPTDPAGNPDLQNFPFKATLDPQSPIVTFALPASNFNDSFVVAAFADVSKVVNGNTIHQDSAWADGIKFTQNSWATYFKGSKKTCCTYDTIEYNIYADQTNKIGVLKVINDEVNLYIKYQTIGNWLYGQTHLYVGSLRLMPLKKSKDPDSDNFPYKKNHNPKVREYTYTIPLSTLPSSFIIAACGKAHRIVNGYVVQTEEIWGKGKKNSYKFSHCNHWGWYTTYNVQICD